MQISKTKIENKRHDENLPWATMNILFSLHFIMIDDLVRNIVNSAGKHLNNNDLN